MYSLIAHLGALSERFDDIECARDLQPDLPDIDEFDLTSSSEVLNLLRESGSRKEPKTKVILGSFRRSERNLSAKIFHELIELEI